MIKNKAIFRKKLNVFCMILNKFNILIRINNNNRKCNKKIILLKNKYKLQILLKLKLIKYYLIHFMIVLILSVNSLLMLLLIN